MFRWVKRFRYAISLLLIVGLAAAVMWWRFKPLARLKLHDGTTIVLERISLGSHEYRGGLGANASLWERIRNTWAKRQALRVDPSIPVYHLRFVGDSPFRLTGSSDVIVIKGPTEEFVAALPNGESFILKWESPRGMTPVTSKLIKRNQRMALHGDGKLLDSRAVEFDGDRLFLIDPVGDRRAEKTQVSFVWSGVHYDWDLPNPFYEREWPDWQPEPFPATRSLGNYTLVVKGWFGKELQLHVLRGAYVAQPMGKDILDSGFYAVDLTYSDATGQTASAPILSGREKAWRVDITVTPARNFPHRPADLSQTETGAGWTTSIYIAPPGED